MSRQSDPAPAAPSQRLYIVTALVAALAGFAAVYVSLGGADNLWPHARAQQTTERLNSGHMTTFVFKKAPEELPEIAFQDGVGAGKSLKDWRGKVVLLNLWATWCAPCRKEMPGLDKLQKLLGSAKFEVVALAVDRAGAEKAKRFLDDTKVANLALFIDTTARSANALRAVGMPTTILIDAEGREIGRLVGPAEWDSEDAVRLVKAHVK